MQATNEMRDWLINEFTENYMEKLFYFCLKKTGSHIEAEDLTQDIALQIITALNKGTIPTSFQHGYGRSRATVIRYGQKKSIIETNR